jgi:Uri superfamily endonuclease
MVPSSPGTYVLISNLRHPQAISIGRLGNFLFPSGSYAYTGSALGAGGLSGRIGRHLRADKTIHWHIDYFLERALLKTVWFSVGLERRECVWAHALARLDGAHIAVPHFGASDCRCPGHLVHFLAPPEPEDLALAVGDSISVHWPSRPVVTPREPATVPS